VAVGSLGSSSEPQALPTRSAERSETARNRLPHETGADAYVMPVVFSRKAQGTLVTGWGKAKPTAVAVDGSSKYSVHGTRR
jgi:hypothetical protein